MPFQQAPPPMALSPERDELSSETKALALDEEMVSRLTVNLEIIFACSFFCFMVQLVKILVQKGNSVKLETAVKKGRTPEEIEKAKMVTFKEKLDVLKHDLGKPNNDIKTNKKLEERDRNKELLTVSPNPKVEKSGN